MKKGIDRKIKKEKEKKKKKKLTNQIKQNKIAAFIQAPVWIEVDVERLRRISAE